MPPALLPIAAVVGALAASAGTAFNIYSATRGAPETPAISMPEIPKMETPTINMPAAQDITKPTATPQESALESAQALSLRQRRGRAASILTGPSGVYSAPNTGALKTILGA